MAIRPTKGITELGVKQLSRKFKNYREVTDSHLFCNLLVAGLEHLIIYCRGEKVQQFFQNVLESIPESFSEDFQQNYREAFEDLELLYDKKQIKLTRLIDSIIKIFMHFLKFLINLKHFRLYFMKNNRVKFVERFRIPFKLFFSFRS